MDVRLSHGGDAEALVLGEVDIPVEVAVGIDDERLAGGRAADQIAGLGELFVVEHAQEHGYFFHLPAKGKSLDPASRHVPAAVAHSVPVPGGRGPRLQPWR